MKDLGFVNTAAYGIKGVNYYWTRRERFGITEEELREASVADGDAYVAERIIGPLRDANAKLREHGFELIVKDGYRPPALYRLIQRKRYETRGKEETDLLLNMETMPHASGYVVDVNLVRLDTGEEAMLRDSNDDPGAFFIDFYRSRDDPKGWEFQRLQDLLMETMLSCGFRIGVKREYWHFEYPPE